MKKLILILMLLGGSLWASTPQLYLTSTGSTTLGAGSTDTIAITTVSLAGDSVGILVELNMDSLSASVVYQYVSPLGYTDTTQFANLPVILTIPTNSKGNFSSAIPRIAGANSIRVYFIITNEKASLQTFTRNLYTIIWR